MTGATLVAAADPQCRPVFYVAVLEVIVIVIGLIDRGIEVGVFNSFQYGVWLQPVVSMPTGSQSLIVSFKMISGPHCRLDLMGRLGILRISS